MKRTLEERVQRLYAAVESEEKKRKKKDSLDSDRPKNVKKPKAVVQLTKERAEGVSISTIKDLAFEMKTTPKAIRKIFRRKGIRKPGGRWEWPEGSDSYLKAKAAIQEYGSGD